MNSPLLVLRDTSVILLTTAIIVSIELHTSKSHCRCTFECRVDTSGSDDVPSLLCFFSILLSTFCFHRVPSICGLKEKQCGAVVKVLNKDWGNPVSKKFSMGRDLKGTIQVAHCCSGIPGGWLNKGQPSNS